jgi:hypothetical protein
VGGEKDFYDGTKSDLGFLGVLAGGVQLAALRGTIQRTIVTHCGEGTPITGPDDIGPVGRSLVANSCFAVNENSGDGFPYLADYKVYDWKDYIDARGPVNIAGLDTATLDATTIGHYTDAWKSTSGSDLEAFANHVRLEAEPWRILPDVLDYFQTPFGYGLTPRTAARTVTFQPDPQGQTPGIRADIRHDWDTGDLPGTVAGDNIDFAGHRINWNMTPANGIGDVDFNGADVTMWGGALKPAGRVIAGTGGAGLFLWHGSRFQFDGYTDNDRLTLAANDARIANTGTVTGVVDARVSNSGELLFGIDAAHWAVGAGTVEIVGGAKAGFDGTSGGAASLTFGPGSTLGLIPGITLTLTGLAAPDPLISSVEGKVLPRIGEVLTGATSGATARVLDVIQTLQVACRVRLEAISGTFVSGESLAGLTSYGGVVDGAAQSIGTVSGTPVYEAPQIAAFTSGMFGKAAPNVVSTVTCAGLLNINVTGLPAGSHDLIVADTVQGMFDSVSVAGLGARDLLLRYSATGLSAELTASGTGLVEQITL